MINDDFLSKNQHPCMPVIQANILFQDLQVPVWAPIQNNSKFQVLKRFKAHELGSPRIEQMLINWPDTPWSLQINVEKVSFGQVKMDVFFLLVFFQNLDSSLWFHPSNKKSGLHCSRNCWRGKQRKKSSGIMDYLRGDSFIHGNWRVPPGMLPAGK